MASYFRICLRRGLTADFSGLDSNRLTLVHFCVSGLDLLKMLDTEDCDRTIAWVKSLMISNRFSGGFRGSPFFVSKNGSCSFWDVGHITMTYSALSILAICGADLSDLDKSSILSLISTLQAPNGGVQCHVHETQSDLRFLFRSTTFYSNQ
jgi:geranylgeranyl transferase type-1 subunit beta